MDEYNGPMHAVLSVDKGGERDDDSVVATGGVIIEIE
jgi:hypothetical protein